MLNFNNRTGIKEKVSDQADPTASPERAAPVTSTCSSRDLSIITKPGPTAYPKRQRLGLFRLNPAITNAEHLLSTYHLDVVALHGLNGDAFNTWTNKNRQLWLKESLPRSLPGARVYTFAYDSEIFSRSNADIGDFARRLLSELSLERLSESDKDRGIVFICHSLGGIVCKKALILAHESSRYANILQRTKALIFFGTPHSGSEQADMLSVMIKVLNTMESVSMLKHVLGKPRQHLADLLQPRSLELENISMSFTDRTENLEIVSFYEEKVMPPFKSLVVPRSNTRIGVPNEELIPLAADHREMCRLDEGDLAYRKVVQVCQTHGVQIKDQHPTYPLNLQEQECLRALNTIDMNDCRAQLRPRSPGTCEWISSNNRLREWIFDEHSGLLCITGDMGSGKSILTSYLVDNIKTIFARATHTDSMKILVSSFFCDDKDVGRNHGQAILRCLIYQILTQRHDLMDHATARFSEVVPERWSILVLWEILKDIMLDTKTGTLVLIIDAIDECESGSRGRVLNLLKQFLLQKLERSSTVIKILISCRNNVDILEEIDQYGRMIYLDDAAEVKRIEQDIKLVVKDQLDALVIKVKWTEEKRNGLERRIVLKSDRNFLWVRLVIERLKRGPQTKKYFEQVIEESPKDLDGLYCRILADIQIENQALAAKILRILVGSLRPLSVAEVQVALAIDSEHKTLRTVEEEGDIAVERTVRLMLGPLVRIHDFHVHLGHQSVKEFLLRLASGQVADLRFFELDLSKSYGISLDSAHLELATACVEFLGLADFEEGKILDENVSAFLELPGATEESSLILMQRATEPTESYAKVLSNQKPPFFEYSASNWTAHLLALGRSIPQHLLKSSILISQPGKICLSNWSDQYRLSSKNWVSLPKDLDPLIVAAFFGLVQLANEVLETNSSEIQENSKSLALSWACRMGHGDVVKTLVDHRTPVTGAWVEGGSPISWACVGGHLEIVKLLLDKASSSQVNMLDENGRSPLSLAVGSSNLAITELLIAREDVDVNMTDRTGSTPLLWNIGSKSEEKDLRVLKCLVSEPRVDIAQRDRYGRTVLSWAAEMGALDAVNILIQSSRSDVQSLLDDPGDTDRGWSPLSWAAYSGHLDVVKTLCTTGRIDVQLASVDKRGQNAVSLAADRNHGEIIKVLAKFYPQGIDCPEESGRTPLSCAMWGSPSNVETVKILLETGLVDVNRKALNGRTPLSYAAAVGRQDLVRILVEEGGADLEIPDNDGNAPGDLYIDWRSVHVKEEINRLKGLRSVPEST